MSLTNKLNELISACFTGIWVESHEHQDAMMEIAQLCRERQWPLGTWDIETGLRVAGSDPASEVQDPLAAIRSVAAIGGADGASVLILKNLHRFISATEIVQALHERLIAGKQHRQIIIVLAPLVQVPVELEKLFVVVEHELPNRQQLEDIARGLVENDDEIPEDEELGRVLDAASGLSRFEAEGAFAMSLIRHGRIMTDTVWELKSQALQKSGLLNLYHGIEGFESLGGLSALKTFTKRALLRTKRKNTAVRPRGVLLLSPPGCGKSQFCKALGTEVGRPVLMLDVGNLMGSLVGQSEERTRRALGIVDAMAPCVLMIDEIEKAFAGVGNSGQTDSGVTARMFGSFLTWLNDHESDVFVVATSNDVTKLPPEFGRSERFDAVVFLDLPQRQQKDAIWDQYISMFELEPDQQRPKDDHWTGAEVRACCRLAALLDVPIKDAAQNVVPVAVTASESIERLRKWASGRCLDADQGGIYKGIKKKRRQAVKTVGPAPSNN